MHPIGHRYTKRPDRLRSRLPQHEPIGVHVGLAAGESIAEDWDLFGTAVIIAARMAVKAEGGQIPVLNVVRDLAAGEEFLFSDRGEVTLRGLDNPVRPYEVIGRA